MVGMTLPRQRVLLAHPAATAPASTVRWSQWRRRSRYGAPVYVRKQIVHNKHVVATLEARGAIFVEETEEVPEGALVVFSAHGVSPAVHEEAAERGPAGHRRHLPAGDQGAQGSQAVRRRGLRHPADRPRGHEEVEGTQGEAPEAIQLVDDAAEVDRVAVADPEKVIWLSQTTLSRRRDPGDR